MTSSGCGATPPDTRFPPRAPRWRRSADTSRQLCLHSVDALLSVVLAPACASCQSVLESPLSGPVCPACWSAVRLVGEPVAGEPSARVAADYQGSLRDIVHAFKYEGRRTLARPLAGLLVAAAGPWLAEAACVVPVPLHPLKRATRGFNQAADLARWLGPPVVHALWRVRLTRAQVGLPAERRRSNVRGAFIGSPLLREQRRSAVIADRIVVLIDDVRTTGATLRECAAVLSAMGAREVRSLTLAQAPIRTTPGEQNDRLRP